VIDGASMLERLRAPRIEPCLVLIAADDSEQTIYHDELMNRAEAWRNQMLGQGGGPGDAVVIILEHGVDLYAAFIGAILGGLVPSIFAHPSDKYAHEAYFKNVGCWLDGADARGLVTYPELAQRLAEHNVLAGRWLLTELASREQGQELRQELRQELGQELGQEKRSTKQCPEASLQSERSQNHVRPEPLFSNQDSLRIIFQQFTSGTTGLKKGVQISEEKLLCQVDQYSQAIGLHDGDKIASWLPLYHDMGLITCCLLPLLTGIPIVAISSFDWVRRPASLLQAVSRHQCTLSWMPNFAFAFMAERIEEHEIRALKLTSWRGIVNCAEPVSVESMLAFRNRFIPFGLDPDALATCYAMAEATFAVTSGGFGRPAMVDQVDVSLLERQQLAVTSKNGRLLLSSGQVMPGTVVRILDVHGAELADRQVGEIVIRSPSLVLGYKGIVSDAFRKGPDLGLGPDLDLGLNSCNDKGAEEEFYTGDTGYLVDDQLFVIGRIKDTLVISGRNLYPQDVEAVVESVPGVISGRTVAFGVDDPRLGTQRLVVMAETKYFDPGQRVNLSTQVRQAVVAQLDIVPSDVRIVNVKTLIKSTSGKISRSANRQHYIKTPSEKPALGAATELQEGYSLDRSFNGLKCRIRRCVEGLIQDISPGAVVSFEDDTALVAQGILDSLAFVSLVTLIEKALSCQLPREIKQGLAGNDSVTSLSHALLNHPPIEPVPLVEKDTVTAAPSIAEPSPLVPQMRDVALQGYEWVPYLMRRGKAGFCSVSLNSDAHGFRRGLDQSGVLSYDRWRTGSWQHGVVLGNSVAYGVGTSSDGKIIGNLLNQQESTLQRRWYTLALRASNMTQERLALEMWAPLDKQWVVWISGINELVALIVGEGVAERPSPFVGERAWCQAIDPSHVVSERHDSLSQRYHNALNSIERDLFLVAQQCRAVGAEFLFVLQPALSWIEKKLTSQEQSLVAAFDSAASPLQRAHSPEQLGDYKVRFRHDVEAICQRNDIAFKDANNEIDFCCDEWLFIDRTHLTDLGHQYLERMVLDWLDSVLVAEGQGEGFPI